jgi:hypothetical protein
MLKILSIESRRLRRRREKSIIKSFKISHSLIRLRAERLLPPSRRLLEKIFQSQQGPPLQKEHP